MATHQALRPEFEELIDPWAPVAQLDSGFGFTEGPVWHPREHFLLFSDMPGDVRRRWDPRRGTREALRPANKCNGLTYDAALNLLVCEHATSSLVRERPDGTREVLASHHGGLELNSPNDACVKSDGSIYFTDPWYGRMPVYGVERPRPLGFQGVYRVPPGGGGGGSPELLVDRMLFEQPNGICFSPDERLLYVNDTAQALIRVFGVQPDGRLDAGRVLASGISSPNEAGVPDGMKCDARGNVWVTAPGGVWVYSPRGEHIGRVRVPEVVGNLCWGGEDWRSLLLTASRSLYRVTTKVGPRPEPYMSGRPAPAAPEPPRGAAAEAPGPRHGAPALKLAERVRLDPARAALIVQDMQNDVVMEGGAFADSGSPAHCRAQDAIGNAARLAEACRRAGVPVVHVWFVVEPGAPGVTMNAPLFEGLRAANALVRGTWGAAPVPGLEPQEGDFVVEKSRMSAFEGSRLETVLKATGRDTLIVTGAWTNMSIEHTSRTGADKGYSVVVPEDACSTMDAEWHAASINYALQNVAQVTRTRAVLDALRGGGR
jgi:gluconolactonase